MSAALRHPVSWVFFQGSCISSNSAWRSPKTAWGLAKISASFAAQSWKVDVLLLLTHQSRLLWGQTTSFPACKRSEAPLLPLSFFQKEITEGLRTAACPCHVYVQLRGHRKPQRTVTSQHILKMKWVKWKGYEMTGGKCQCDPKKRHNHSTQLQSWGNGLLYFLSSWNAITVIMMNQFSPGLCTFSAHLRFLLFLFIYTFYHNDV